MSALFGIIYSPNQSVCRRIIHPDDDAELSDPSLLLPGEAMLVLPRTQITGNKFVANALVAAATGKATMCDRCVYVDAAKIVAAIHYADPFIDGPPPGLTFAATNEYANIGDTFERGQFYRDYVVTDRATRTIVQAVLLPVVNPVSPVIGGTLMPNPDKRLRVGMKLPTTTEVPMPTNSGSVKT